MHSRAAAPCGAYPNNVFCPEAPPEGFCACHKQLLGGCWQLSVTSVTSMQPGFICYTVCAPAHFVFRFSSSGRNQRNSRPASRSRVPCRLHEPHRCKHPPQHLQAYEKAHTTAATTLSSQGGASNARAVAHTLQPCRLSETSPVNNRRPGIWHAAEPQASTCKHTCPAHDTCSEVTQVSNPKTAQHTLG